jgi:hypothetical protein
VDLSDEVQVRTVSEAELYNARFPNRTSSFSGSGTVTTTSSLRSPRLTNTYVNYRSPGGTADFGVISGQAVLFGYTVQGSINTQNASAWAQPLDPTTGDQPAGCNTTAARNGADWRCRGYAAAECSLFPCTRTYHAQVINGALAETVVDESPIDMGQLRSLSPNGRFVNSVLYLPCVDPTQAAQLQRLGHNLSRPDASSSPWIPFKSTENPPAVEQDLFAQGCIAMTDPLFHNGLNMYFSRISGNLTGTYYLSSAAVAAFTGPPLLRTLHNYGNFSLARTEGVFRNISLSLTNHIRTSAAPAGLRGASSPATGVAYASKTCLHVAWPWLALPGVLGLATLAFVIAVGYRAGRRLGSEASSWRTSPLPLMPGGEGHGAVDDSLTASTAYSGASWIRNGGAVAAAATTATGQHVRDMEQAARGVMVRLKRNGNHLALRRES